VRLTVIALLVSVVTLVPAASALAGPPPVPHGAAWIVEVPGHGGVLLQHAPRAKREIASLTKLMTAHLVLKYARLDEVVAAGGDAVAIGESSVPLQLGERQTVHALLAALIVHSANDASIVLAHATIGRPAAQAAVAAEARRLGRSLPAGPVARFVLLMNAEAHRLGLRDTVYRTPHGLDEPGAHSSARDVLELARLDMESPIFRGLAGRRTVSIPGHRLQTSNTLLPLYAGLDGVKTGHTDQAGWNLAASADRGGMRIYAILLGAPDEASRDRDIARLMDWGFDRYKQARLVRAGQLFGHAGTVRVVAAKGLSVTLDPGERVRERIVLPRRLDRAVRAGQPVGYVELRSGRGVLGRVPLVAASAGGGHPALLPWLRSRLRKL
jgi:D-alanyl-D-alanine carboxypeptidase (penicillin-binding protein 5/6)